MCCSRLVHSVDIYRFTFINVTGGWLCWHVRDEVWHSMCAMVGAPRACKIGHTKQMFCDVFFWLTTTHKLIFFNWSVFPGLKKYTRVKRKWLSEKCTQYVHSDRFSIHIRTYTKSLKSQISHIWLPLGAVSSHHSGIHITVFRVCATLLSSPNSALNTLSLCTHAKIYTSFPFSCVRFHDAIYVDWQQWCNTCGPAANTHITSRCGDTSLLANEAITPWNNITHKRGMIQT